MYFDDNKKLTIPFAIKLIIAPQNTYIKDQF